MENTERLFIKEETRGLYAKFLCKVRKLCRSLGKLRMLLDLIYISNYEGTESHKSKNNFLYKKSIIKANVYFINNRGCLVQDNSLFTNYGSG